MCSQALAFFKLRHSFLERQLQLVYLSPSAEGVFAASLVFRWYFFGCGEGYIGMQEWGRIAGEINTTVNYVCM